MTFRVFALLGSLVFVFLLLSAPAAIAKDHVFQLSLFTPIQIYPEDSDISGLCINLLYGKDASVNGMTWGFVNHTASGTSGGIQFGLVNFVEDKMAGGQDGFVNYVKGELSGTQWGFVNYAKRAHGFQFGFVNYAETMKGLQIGLVNIIKTGGQFPVFPILNWSF